MVYKENHPQFFTATIYEWNHLEKHEVFPLQNRYINIPLGNSSLNKYRYQYKW